MNESQNASRTVFSLTAIRRFYFYAVALVSLIAGLAAVDGLLEIVTEIWRSEADQAVGMTNYWRNAVARNGGLLLVAVPVFLLHWGYIQRRLTEITELQAGLRKLFLYAASGVAIGFAAVRGYAWLASAGYLALGGTLSQSQDAYGLWPHLAGTVLIGLALTGYFQHILRRDGDYGREVTWGASVRRLFFTLVALIGLILVIAGSAQMIQALWKLAISRGELVIGGDWPARQIGEGLSRLLIGALLLRRTSVSWLAIIDAVPAEASTALRRFFLYASVAISALAVLAPAAMLLRELLLLLFGSEGGNRIDLLERMAMPVSFIPAGLFGWFWYRRYLRQEAARYGESPEAATIRRIYYYTVAATALVLFWFGLVEIVSALLDVLMTRGALVSSEQIWREPLATGLALCAVSAPIWVQHWRTVQSVAQRDDAAGHAERNSAPRKVYLYGVALAGALLILFNTSQVLYRLLLLALGEPGVDFFTTQTANELAQGIVAVALWTVHILAIRGDGRLETAAEAAQSPLSTPIPTEKERAYLQARIVTLEDELARTRADLARIDQERSALNE